MPRGRTWVPIDIGISRDPDLLTAGPWGPIVFGALLRIAKARGTAGHLAPRLREPVYVAGAEFGFASDSPEAAAIRDALVTLCDARVTGQPSWPLVQCDCSPGCVYLRSWDAWNRDPLHSERQRRYTARKSAGVAAVSDGPVTGSDGGVTDRDAKVTWTGHAGQNKTGHATSSASSASSGTTARSCAHAGQGSHGSGGCSSRDEPTPEPPADWDAEEAHPPDHEPQAVPLGGAPLPNTYATGCHLCGQRLGPGVGWADGRERDKDSGKWVGLYRHRGDCPKITASGISEELDRQLRECGL